MSTASSPTTEPRAETDGDFGRSDQFGIAPAVQDVARTGMLASSALGMILSAAIEGGPQRRFGSTLLGG